MTTQKSNQRGFAMAEVMMALIVFSLMAGALHISMTGHQADLVEHDLLDQVAGEVHRMAQAAQQYALANEAAWPDEDADCATAHAEMTSSDWLKGVTLQSPFYDTSGNATNYAFDCADDRHFAISVTAENTEQASDLRRRLPGSEVSGNTLTAYYPKITAAPQQQGPEEQEPEESLPANVITLSSGQMWQCPGLPEPCEPFHK